ncbi:MAG: Ig-like domain-containing protein, partial [Gemmatimonadaceae bacterium]
GGTVSLTAVTYDAAGHALAGRPVVWASSSSQVATVDASGKVTGVSAGSASITGTSEGKTGSSSVTVTLVPVAAVSVSPGSASLIVGRTASLSAVTTDANGNVLSGRSVTWSSSNSAVATVSAQGLVTSRAAGTSTVSATSEGKTGTAQVVVTAPPPPSVASLTVTPPTRNLDIGGSATLTATVKDSTGAVLSGRTIIWATSAASIATVSSAGLVTALSAGTAAITATSGGVTGTAAVTVNPAPPAVVVARVKISPSSVTLRDGQTRTLTVQVLDASNHVLSGRTVTWTASGSDAVRLTRTGPTTASVKGSGDGVGITVVTATCEGVTDSIVVTFVE